MKKITQIAFFLISILSLQAQDDGTIDLSFLGDNKGQKGVSGAVHTIAVQPDGKLLIGGAFETYNQIWSPKLIRVNPDGSIDSSFNQTLLRDSNSSINSIVIQPDGKILVAGGFEMRTPHPDNELLEEDIMRLNADGTRDETFIAPGNTSGCGDIRSVALQSDGKIIIVGDISYCVSSTIDNNENIIRLNSDGSLDETFTTVVTDLGNGNSGEPIHSVRVQSDDKILIAGNFNQVNGVTQQRLARLNSDGTLDTSYTIGTGFNSAVNDIALQQDGKLLVVGNFTAFNATSQNQIVRLHTDGSLDAILNSGAGVGRFQPSNGYTAARNIENVVIQSDGKILIGGDYNRYDGTAVSRYTRLNSDGTFDNTFFNVDDLGIEIASVYTSLVLPSGDFIVGGNFDKHNSYKKSGLIKLTSSGQVDLSFNSGHGPTEEYFSTEIREITKASGNKLYVAGRFREYDDVFSRNIARINSDGSIDTSFSTGTDELINGFDDGVNDVMEQPSGKIIVVGEFETYNGNPAPGIAKLNNDGSFDNTFSVGTGVSSSNLIDTVVELADGKFLIGGFFDEFDGFTTRNLARLNADGSIDTTFFVSSASQIYDIFLLNNGQFFIGTYSYNDDIITGRLAKINPDGTRDTSFNATGIISGTTKIVKVLGNGQILVGGYYSSQGGSVLKLNADGSLDTGFTLADINARVEDMELQDDGKLIIGGNFDDIDGRDIRGVARLNSDGTFDDTFNPEVVSQDPDTYAGTDDFSNTVNSLELRDSGQLLVGGDFRSYNAQPKSPLIALFAGIPETLNTNPFEISERNISVFPNPASDLISISSEKEIQNIQLYTISGKQILNQQDLKSYNHRLDVSQLSKGFYLLKISNHATTITKKLVIN
ncbi:T9SS type A sorting domain-containing protein [Psychroserpens ponticola]|uniref:T9SS type A sorting domain-containing protein n=1 Tax=Psychroserpens ponticola TaxID=2932268 RepID=A0ABY7RXW6_9FLAO|nr:T9SS type A sorting domain-containing protein [Psychroserpens ponticola]WCO01991.1 T9SS type A sorting domain-containing protein [Psychroserpens ponticola]